MLATEVDGILLEAVVEVIGVGDSVVGGTILAYVPEWVRGKYLARA